MIANGLAQRRLRSRSAAHGVVVGGVAGEVVAAEALDRDDARRRAGRATAARQGVLAGRGRRAGRPVGRQARRGPQAGQATGSAWNRRSAGSRYSASQAGAQREGPHRRLRPVVRAAPR